jgi:hypothetical protein
MKKSSSSVIARAAISALFLITSVVLMVLAVNINGVSGTVGAGGTPTRTNTPASSTNTRSGTPTTITDTSITFGPATVADAQRTEGEPLNWYDKFGNYWTAGPFGFVSGFSFVQRSTDNGDQFNIVSSTGTRPDPPRGGGDSEIVTDDQGFVYYVDLQDDNFGTAVSNDNGNTWRKNYVAVAGLVTDRQWLVFDNGLTGNADDNTIFLFQNDLLGQTVVSSPGSTGPTDAMGGLVWQQAVSRTSSINNGSPCGQARFDTISRIMYYPCANGNHIEITKLHVDPSQRTGLTFTKVNTPASPGGSVGAIFPNLSIDSAGNIYAVWIDEGNHQVYFSASTNQGATWGPVTQINSAPANNNVFVWANAGVSGRLAVAWIGNVDTTPSDNMPSWFNNRVTATGYKWYGYAALITDATTAPSVTQARFTEKPMYYGQICSGGLGCTVSMGDRTMADFFALRIDPHDGAMRIIYNDVTSQHHGAHLFEERQLTGPTALGTTLNYALPSNPMNDPTGDAQVPHYMPVTGPGANQPQLDFTQVRVSQPAANMLRFEMTLNNLSSLLPPAGKANAFWITRFQAQSVGDSNGTPGTEEAYRIFYVGAESAAGQAPTFFAGSGNAADATTHAPGNGCLPTSAPGACKIVFYPAEVTAAGCKTGNTFVIDVPLTNGFGTGRPINGTMLYNVTAFSGGRNTADDVYADADSTRSFDFQLGNISGSTPLLSVVSRKVHGTAGTFDINLPLTGPRGVECRTPGQTGTVGVDYKMVFTFTGPVTSCGTPSTGTVTPSGNTCTVNLTNVPNAQYTTVTLTGVSVPTACPAPFVGNVSGTMGLLIGDVNGDAPNAPGLVDSGDVFLVRQQTGQTTTSSNFRKDINASGLIDSGDVFLTRQKTGTQLPTQP